MALYTQYETVPPAEQIAAYRELVKQRANHVPVAYLVGKAWFFSLEFNVTREVLIPRPDTETLVEYVIQTARQHPEWSAPSMPAILDLCTGSGAIGIALAKQLSTASVVATDISGEALAVARGNAEMHKLGDRITFLEGDLFAPLEKQAAPALFHVIAANPPYIPTGELANLPVTIREHEPRGALDGGPDGLTFHRRIIAGARPFLQQGGLVIMEMQFDQGSALQAAFAAAGHFANVRTIRDAGGHPRCVAGNLA